MTMPKIEGYTPEELSILTPDELSALQAEGGEDADAIAALAEGGDDGTALELNTDGTVTDPADADAAAAAAAAAEAEAAKKGEQPTATTDDDDPFIFEAPADAAEKRTTLTAERDKAFSDLMEGTIDTDAYNAINNRVSDELAALASAVSKAEMSAAMREHEQKKAWKRTITDFFEDAKKEGADYLANNDLHVEFDGLVKVFAAEAQAKGMSDVGLKASKYALEQAQIVMRARHGFKAAAAPTPGGAAKTDAEKAIEEANKVRHGLKTLTNIPAAAQTLTDDSPLAKIASLEGEELELYMASLSPAQMRALEAAGAV